MKTEFKIEITLHARERMQLRLGVKPNKIERVAFKAWHCEHWDQWKYKKLNYQRQFYKDGQWIRYRQAYGKIWVFRIIKPNVVRLLTMYE